MGFDLSVCEHGLSPLLSFVTLLHVETESKGFLHVTSINEVEALFTHRFCGLAVLVRKKAGGRGSNEVNAIDSFLSSLPHLKVRVDGNVREGLRRLRGLGL